MIDSAKQEDARVRHKINSEIGAFFDEKAAAFVERTLAEEKNLDLVVIGTHGRKGWRRAVLGSGAVQIVRESHLPVLLIPGVDRSGPPR